MDIQDWALIGIGFLLGHYVAVHYLRTGKVA